MDGITRIRSAAALLGVVAIMSTPATAFMISVHRDITLAALQPFAAAISQSERDSIVQGSVDADLVEGGLPFVGGPYDQRFHFDNEFTYDAVLANYAIVKRAFNRNFAKPERDPWEFGKLLHAVEDFYSHSNYVIIYRDFVRQNGDDLVGSIPTFEEVRTGGSPDPTLVAMLKHD